MTLTAAAMAAWSMAAPVAAQTCGEVLPGELANRCFSGWSVGDITRAVDRYASSRRWASHQEAHVAGLPWGMRVYGEILTDAQGRDFDSSRRNQWLAAYRPPADPVVLRCMDRFVDEVVRGGLLPLLFACECRPRDADTQFALVLDQDSVIPPSSDKDYTMGVVLEWRGGWVDRSWLAKGWDRADLAGTLLDRRWAGVARHHAFSFGDSAFTPAKVNLGRTDPVCDDRPYANLLFLSLRRTTADKLGPAASTALLSEMTVGILGLQLGKAVQTAIHRAKNDVIPGGWHHQISNGGEPTARYRIGARKRLPFVGGPSGWGLDTSGALDAQLGFYTNASAGARVRFGKRESSWYDYDRTSTAVYRPPDRRSCLAPRKWEAFVALSGGHTLWAFNELLQGGFRPSHVRLGWGKNPAPLRHGVWDGEVTLTARWRGISLGFVQAWHTALFGGERSRPHHWRTLSVSF